MITSEKAKDIAMEKLKLAHDIIMALDEDTKKRLYIYKPFIATTQNLSYINNLISNDLNCFTILGSGDSIFQLLYKGVQNITAVDINSYQADVFYLRKAALKGLSYDEFYNFIIDTKGKDFLSHKIFIEKVLPCFDTGEEISACFWSVLLDVENTEAISLRFFKGGLERYSFDLYKESVSYLKRKWNYEAVKEALKTANIKIILEDAVEYLYYSQEKYSCIDITNVLMYYCQYKFELDFDKYVKGLFKVLKKIKDENLEPHGIFIVDYMFGINKRNLLNGDKYKYVSESDMEKINLQIYLKTFEAIKEIFKDDVGIFEVREVADALPVKGLVDSVIFI